MGGELQKLLARSWIFGGLTSPELDHLATVARVRAYRAKQVVVRKGDRGGEIFAILRGRLKALSPGVAHDTALNIMGPGEMFGEIALLDGTERSATVTALEVCQLAIIERAPFQAFLEAHPSVSFKLLGVLARRVRALTERVEDRAHLDLPARLAKCLIALADRHGKVEGPAVRIELRLSQQELGELTDATRESVNKLLRAWKTEGWVEHQPEAILVRRADVLRDLSRGRR